MNLARPLMHQAFSAIRRKGLAAQQSNSDGHTQHGLTEIGTEAMGQTVADSVKLKGSK